MKKLSLVFLLVFGLFAAQGVSAATAPVIKWVPPLPASNGTPTGDPVDNDTLFGNFVFTTVASGFDHSWTFNLDIPALVDSAASVLVGFGTSVGNVFLDGNPMTFLGAGQYSDSGVLAAGNHIILLTSLGGKVNSQYNLSLSASAVPVPAAIWLFGSALAGLVAASRRKVELTA